MTNQKDRKLKRLIDLGQRKGYLLSAEIDEMLPDDAAGGPEAPYVATAIGNCASGAR